MDILEKGDIISDPYNNNSIKNQLDKNPPRVNKQYDHIFNYENNNIFSSFNNVFGEISKCKIPHNFLDHLMVNNNKISLTKRYRAKVLSTIYYSKSSN